MSQIYLFKYFKISSEIMHLAVMYYIRYPLSFRQVEDILHEHGIDVCHETIRFWGIRKRRAGFHYNWQWYLDEIFVKLNGKDIISGCAVDHEGEALESFITKHRDKHAALRFIIKTMRRHGSSRIITTDRCDSYRAALRDPGVLDRHQAGGRSNNRCENSHLPFRRRERVMQTFKSVRSLQKFTSVQAQLYNHFNHERHLVSRDTFKQKRATALAEWFNPCAA